MNNVNNKRLANAAAIVMSSVVVSRITGYLREMLIPAKFGFGGIADVYNIAFLVPDLMFSLLVGGAISAALVPVLSGHIERKEEPEGWKSVSSFINVTFLLMLVFCALGMIFAPQLISIVAPAYGKRMPEQLDLTVRLTRVLFPSVSFLMLAGLCNGVLNSYQRFAAAAYGPTIYNLLSCASIFFLSSGNKEENYGVDRVVIGVMLSALCYFLFQLFFAFKNIKGNYSLSLDLRHSGFRRLFKLAVPSLLTSSVMQINIIINQSFSTWFDAGSVASLRTADRTWQMPLGIIAQAMGVAMLPTLSAKFAAGDVENYKSTLLKCVKTVLFLSVPAAVGILVLNVPIVRTMFQTSELVTEEGVQRTAGILFFFSIALISQSIATILNRGFFAANDTKTTLYVSSGTIAANIALTIFFYHFTKLYVMGMALAYTISSVINSVLLACLLNRKIKGINPKKLAEFCLRLVPATAAMALLLLCLNRAIPEEFVTGPVNLATKLKQVAALGTEILAGVFVYFFVALKTKVAEAGMIRDLVLEKLGRPVRNDRGSNL